MGRETAFAGRNRCPAAARDRAAAGQFASTVTPSGRGAMVAAVASWDEEPARARECGPADMPRHAAAGAVAGGWENAVMTIGGSIALIAIGAILRFAVTWKPKYVDLHATGVILMIAGAVGLVVSVAVLVSRRRSRAATEVYEQRRYVEPPQ